MRKFRAVSRGALYQNVSSGERFRAAIRNSTLPSGPVIGLGVTPSTRQPRDRSHAATAAQTRSCTAGSRTTPPLPISPPLRLELRLDERDQPAAGLGETQRGVEHLGEAR